MREYLIVKTMARFNVTEDTARVIIRELDKIDMIEDYYSTINNFNVLNDLLYYYNINQVKGVI